MSSVFIQSKPKKLSLDKIGQLEDDLETNPLDYNKWIKYLDHILAKDNQEQVRKAFDKYLEIFKFDGVQWNRYIKYELSRGEKEVAESLFQKSFGLADNVELFRSYVDYVRSVTDFITGGEKARGTVIQAFEFAVDKVGLDVSSDGLWQDYIGFLKTWTPGANWEQQQKIDLMRKVYKKFLAIPTENIESSWAQYTKWENEINPSVAQKYVSEKSSDFMAARSWNTEWQHITNKKLKRTINPQSSSLDNSTEEQIKYWNSWIELEKKNSLELKDSFTLQKRINYVYKQATYALPFIPQLWFEYVKYLLITNEENNLNDCIETLKDGLKLNPKSLLLSFQVAELYEKDSSFEKSKLVYENLISKLTVSFDKVTKELNELKEKMSPPKKEENSDDDEDENMEESNKNGEETNQQPKINGNGLPNIPGLPNKPMSLPNIPNLPGVPTTTAFPNSPNLPKIPTHAQLSSSVVSLADSKQLQTLEKQQKQISEQITLIYIKLMIASKRAEGMKQARNVFKQARKFPGIDYQVYIESALLEHYADNKKTAIKVFDIGQKAFPTNGEFALKYLDYLIMINDTEKLRSTLQTADTNFAKEISQLTDEINVPDIEPILKAEKEKKLKQLKTQLKNLYKKYISFAATNLSLDIANTFAKKYDSLFAEDDPIDLFTDRYKLGRINIIKRDELDQDGYDKDYDNEDEPVRKRRRRISISNNFENETQSSVVRNIQESSRFDHDLQNGHSNNANNESNFVGPSIVALMTALPNASYFGLPSDSVFNSDKLVTLFANLSNIS
ncbi:RNA14 [Candida jiufengensis]|uniref:RNA14 n=1 Tax=Candida jiufengensis TaxID=497108 RepID=UPI0022240C71|nr:RNA14 [Candida jiufengensis]KAI5951353.1 RNA14 [Candida jiufengensis]